MSIVFILLPDVILVALGWLMLHKLNFNREFFAATEKMVYFIMFPALLFRSVLLSPLDINTAGTSLTACALLAAAGWILGWLAKPTLKSDTRSINSVQQCVYRFSTYIALSLAPSVGGAEGVAIMAVFIGFTVPLANVLAVHALSAGQGGMLKSLISNPLVLATVSGITLNILGFQLPTALDNTLAKLGQASIPLGLICVGAALQLREGSSNAALVAWITTARLILMPVCALLIATIMGFSILQTQMFVIFAAIPTAPAAYVLTARMGGDARLVANTISAQTLACVVTLPIWLLLIVKTPLLTTLQQFLN